MAKTHGTKEERNPAPGSTGVGGAQGPVRVMVSDDEIIVLGLLAMLSRDRDQVEVVGGPRDGDDLLRAAVGLGTEVALVGTHLFGVRGLERATELLAREPPFRVVIFTHDIDERALFEALRLGASGFLLKSLTGSPLVDALVRIRDGEVVVDPAMAAMSPCEPPTRATASGGGRVPTLASPNARVRSLDC